MEPQFNEPLYNTVPGVTNNFLQPGQKLITDNKMYGTEPLYNKPRFNEILIITNTMKKYT